MLESTLEKMAEKILSMDEASLSSLWEKYKVKMDRFDASKEWEKSVVIFFIINSVRVKNHIFNERIMNREKNIDNQSLAKGAKGTRKPNLRLVK